MLLKKREQPIEMRKLESLEGRMTLNADYTRQLHQMRLGYAGECLFDCMAEDLDDCVIRINDFILARQQLCQIDSIFISNQKIYLLDIKNWSKTYTLNQSGFESLHNDPLDQLKRARKIFINMLQSHGIRLPVEARLIFINPDIVLYGIDANLPIVLPQQIPDYFDKIRHSSSPITKWEERTAKIILAQHTDENPYRLQVLYSTESVQPGILCSTCRILMAEKSHKFLYCPKCLGTESKAHAVRRSEQELLLLFPDSRPHIHKLYKWCGEMVSKQSLHSLKASRVSRN